MLEAARQRVIAALLHAHDTATLAPPPSEEAGFDLDEGYRIGHALHETLVRRGYRPVGRKVGFTNPTARSWRRARGRTSWAARCCRWPPWPAFSSASPGRPRWPPTSSRRGR